MARRKPAFQDDRALGAPAGIETGPRILSDDSPAVTVMASPARTLQDQLASSIAGATPRPVANRWSGLARFALIASGTLLLCATMAGLFQPAIA